MDKISFWQLLKDNKVVIPIIQRDYAQGRIGKEHIREKFLTQIKAALEDRKNSGELDFVYGTTKNDVFYPLDGQQRLTTLWLLHWFVASKAGKLEEAKEILKKFSYETRTSSREFCKKLCEFDISKVSKVSNAIQKQTWFYTAWKQDPTIQSMLRMLEGTDIKNKKGNDFSDGIEEVFKCYDGDHLECRLLQCQYIDYWEKLTGIDCPIKFSKLEISSNELPVSDDLYIKMNARGKPLTSFENFKADLIASLEDKVACEYGGLIDNGWTNHFWNKNEIDFFDAKWMAFLCRFAVCVRIENEEDSNEKVANVLKEWSVYKNDTDKLFSYEYKDYRDFKGIFNAGVLSRLNDIFEGWSKLSNLKDFTLDSSWGDKFCFIPSGNKNQAVSTLTMKTRVLFYGTMLFCEKLHFCKESGSFKDCLIGKWNAWKRVMWNLAENTNESSALDGFVGVMKMFKQLGKGCLDIYNYLNEDGNKVEYNFEQLKEEKDKAKMILCNATEPNKWEAIIEAERLPWFRGRISAIIADDGIIDNDLKSWFSKENVGEENSQYRQAWVKKVVRCIEQEYNAATDKPWVDFPVRSIIIGDPSLKEAIYNKTQRGWIAKARNVQLDSSASVWIKRMAGDDKEENEPWKNRICISSYRGGDVYAYRGAYITGAYRLDEKINWWYDFVSETGAKVESWQTNEKGTWIQCEITSGDYKGVYALCHDGTASFAQKKMKDHSWYPPSNEEAKKIWEEIVDITNQGWVTNLLKRLKQKQP